LPDPLPATRAFRIFSARRIDQAWLASESGELLRVQLEPKFDVVGKLELGPDLYDLDVTDEFIVALVAHELPDRGRRWQLAVYDANGQSKLSADWTGPAAPGEIEDWVPIVTRNQNLAVCRYASLVLVGGPDSLDVRDIKTGQRTHAP
jgi:hypothetical protein